MRMRVMVLIALLLVVCLFGARGRAQSQSPVPPKVVGVIEHQGDVWIVFENGDVHKSTNGRSWTRCTNALQTDR